MAELRHRRQQETEGQRQAHSQPAWVQRTFPSLKAHTRKVRM